MLHRTRCACFAGFVEAVLLLIDIHLTTDCDLLTTEIYERITIYNCIRINHLITCI